MPQSGQSILAGIALPTYGYGPGQSGATNDFDDFDEEDVSEGNDEDEDDNLMSFLQRQFSIGSNENDHPNNKSPLNAVQKDFDEEFGNWPESEVSGKGDTGRSARNRNTIVEVLTSLIMFEVN